MKVDLIQLHPINYTGIIMAYGWPGKLANGFQCLRIQKEFAVVWLGVGD